MRLLLSVVFSLSVSAWAVQSDSKVSSSEVKTPPSSSQETESFNFLDELDPNDPNIEKILNEYDQMYEQETGESPFLQEPEGQFYQLFNIQTCFRQNCAVWAQVVKSTQTMYLYVQGEHVATWKVSTGLNGSTPNFDTHPNGRIYDRYTSSRYPGGDYRGLGNMPYAVFIKGGFAIHGTAESNWPKLGRPASHGCVRLHPDNGYRFNRLVRQYGVKNTWITVQP